MVTPSGTELPRKKMGVCGGYLQHHGLTNFMLAQVILESNMLIAIFLQEKWGKHPV
jgi:hypothetical protein